MTFRQTQQLAIQLRLIQREKVRQRLAITAILALITASCDSTRNRRYAPISTADNLSSEKIPAVFYKTTAECEADAQKQQENYAVLKAAFEAGRTKEEPTPPALSAEACEPQMLAAQAEHKKHAPTYASLADCESEGLACEPVPNNNSNSNSNINPYYSPRFGGYYFFPSGGFGSSRYTYVDYGGSPYQVHQPRTLYQSNTPGQVVTPNGRVMGQPQTGVGFAPAHTRTAAPVRPKGTAARGTVSGRGNKGFGSTFRGTGRGGK